MSDQIAPCQRCQYETWWEQLILAMDMPDRRGSADRQQIAMLKQVMAWRERAAHDAAVVDATVVMLQTTGGTHD